VLLANKQHLGPKLEGGWARGASKKFATVEASNFKFGTQLGFETSLPKNNDLDQNLRGSGLGEHPKKKCGTPTYFATVEASNFKFGTQIGFGTSLPKNDVYDQNWRGSELGEHPKKIWDPLLIPATVEASNFKFGTQLGFGTSLPKKTTIWTKICEGLG